MPGAGEMREAMLSHFAAEKQEALILLLVGAAALAVSALLLRGGGAWRAMAIPVGAVALIQLAVGGSVYLRTDRQVAGLEAQLAAAPADHRSGEMIRMDRVMSGFRLYKAVEVALLLAGVALTVLFPHRQGLYAIGTGLVMQPAFMLVLDLFAERRGHLYLEALKLLT
jgi:hypothetical protein